MNASHNLGQFITHIVLPSHRLEAPGRVLNMARYPYISTYSGFVLTKITPGLKHFIDAH